MRPDWLRDDPMRERAQVEIHARPVEELMLNSRVRRVAAMLPRDADAIAQAAEGFARWCHLQGVCPPLPDSRQHAFTTRGMQVTWELHTEFVTLTWTSGLADWDNWPPEIG